MNNLRPTVLCFDRLLMWLQFLTKTMSNGASSSYAQSTKVGPNVKRKILAGKSG